MSEQRGEYPTRQSVSVMRAGELAGVSRRTIYNWMNSGKVEWFRTAGGSRRIYTDTLWREAAKVDLKAQERGRLGGNAQTENRLAREGV